MDSGDRVLIIGDKRLNVDRISGYLAGAGYEVMRADAGKESIEITGSTLPDVIVVDIAKPAREGFDIVGTLKRHRETAGIPTIQITARNNRKNRKKDHECAADEFLARPVGKPEILGSVRSFLELKRHREKILEAILKEEKDLAFNLVQNISTPTFVLDAGHRVIIWNKACEELTGFRACEMIGGNRQWQPFYPHPRPTLADALIDGDAEAVSELYPESSTSRINPLGLQSEGWFTTRDGRTLYLLFDAEPVFNSDGRLVAVIESFRDLTEIKKSAGKLEELSVELVSMREQMVLQQKMACIGRLATGIAHRVDSPVSDIAGNLDSLLKCAERLESLIRLQSEIPEDTRSGDTPLEMKNGTGSDYLLRDMKELIRKSIESVGVIKAMLGNLENCSRDS